MKILDLSTIDHPTDHAAEDAEQIGHAADGRPLFRAKLGFSPATAFDLSLAGNWIEARVEFPAGAVANPRAEVLFPPPPPPEVTLGLNLPAGDDGHAAAEAHDETAPETSAEAPAETPVEPAAE